MEDTKCMIIAWVMILLIDLIKVIRKKEASIFYKESMIARLPIAYILYGAFLLEYAPFRFVRWIGIGCWIYAVYSLYISYRDYRVEVSFIPVDVFDDEIRKELKRYGYDVKKLEEKDEFKILHTKCLIKLNRDEQQRITQMRITHYKDIKDIEDRIEHIKKQFLRKNVNEDFQGSFIQMFVQMSSMMTLGYILVNG